MLAAGDGPQAAYGPLLRVDGLQVAVETPTGPRLVIDRVGFELAAGRTLCLAGESGSGKSLTALAIMGLLPNPAVHAAGGSIELAGRDLLALPERALRQLRGSAMAMVFQEPMTSLNPVLRIGTQLEETVRAHERVGRAAARRRALEVLDQVEIGEPARRLGQYPHELSGGMRQRVMIAMAMCCRPRLLIADEPTTALDVTVQAQVLALLRDLQRATGMGLLLITHDMGVVAAMADDVLVMRHGRPVELAPVQALFRRPAAAYTQALMAAVPRLGAGPRPPPVRGGSAPPVLELAGLGVAYPQPAGPLGLRRRWVPVVSDVHLTLRPGETLAIVGESGSGKSSTARAIMGLVAFTGGLRLDGAMVPGHGRHRPPALRRLVQMVFQDPYGSLDPKMTVGDLVGEPLRVHGLARGAAVGRRVAALLEQVGLETGHAARYPHAFSGGQRQRIGIARALALEPKVVVADEPVSALDVTVQAQILELLLRLQAELGLAFLFISHDMAVVERISHRVAVMLAGRIVETGPTAEVFAAPRHAYTRRLLAAVPVPDPAGRPVLGRWSPPAAA